MNRGRKGKKYPLKPKSWGWKFKKIGKKKERTETNYLYLNMWRSYWVYKVEILFPNQVHQRHSPRLTAKLQNIHTNHFYSRKALKWSEFSSSLCHSAAQLWAPGGVHSCTQGSAHPHWHSKWALCFCSTLSIIQRARLCPLTLPTTSWTSLTPECKLRQILATN